MSRRHKSYSFCVYLFFYFAKKIGSTVYFSDVVEIENGAIPGTCLTTVVFTFFLSLAPYSC